MEGRVCGGEVEGRWCGGEVEGSGGGGVGGWEEEEPLPYHCVKSRMSSSCVAQHVTLGPGKKQADLKCPTPRGHDAVGPANWKAHVAEEKAEKLAAEEAA